MTRYLCAAAIALTCSTVAVYADMLPLNAISNYLNGLKTAQARFTQINDDGTVNTGTVYIKRPGRMRFEYDPPNSAIVVAGSGAVVIDDTKSNQPPETYPLRRTPLALILDDRVDLGRARMVTAHGFDGTATVVTAQDPENPEYGYIQMKFTAQPVELRQWVVNDGTGGETTVVLGELNTGVDLPNRLFDTGSPGQGVNR